MNQSLPPSVKEKDTMVYVDKPIRKLGRMLMCHMVADTTDELNAMADRIGVDRLWIQNAGTHREHFDVCKSKREKAITYGAVPVNSRAIVRVMRRKESP